MTQRAPGAFSIDVPLSLSEDLIKGLGSGSNRHLCHALLIRILYRYAKELAQAAPRAPPIISMRFEATRIFFNKKLYRHVQELFQGVAEVFSIEFNDDLIKELEGIFKGLHEHLPLTSIKGLIKKCTRNQPKELQEHHPLIVDDDLIWKMDGIGPGNIWSMSHKFQ